MLSSLFVRCMKRRGVKASDPYDWERPLVANEGLPTTRSLPTVTAPPALTTATTINQAPTTPNIDTNNQENVEPDNRKEVSTKLFYMRHKKKQKKFIAKGLFLFFLLSLRYKLKKKEKKVPGVIGI